MPRPKGTGNSNLGGKTNGEAVFKVLTSTPHVEPYEITLPANITRNRVFVFCRAFCRDTFKQLDAIAGATPYELLSYKLDNHAT